MSQFIRTAILTFLVAPPLLFTLLACRLVAPFGLVVPAWVSGACAVLEALGMSPARRRSNVSVRITCPFSCAL